MESSFRGVVTFVGESQRGRPLVTTATSDELGFKVEHDAGQSVPLALTQAPTAALPSECDANSRVPAPAVRPLC